MADFCKQCSIDTFGEDCGDFKNLYNKPLEKGYGWPAICEGCGPTFVNNEGKCISSNCLKKHGVNNAKKRYS